MICCLKLIIYKTKCITSKIRLKHICLLCICVILLDLCGVFSHIFETSFDDNFIYPYDGDITPFVEALKHNKKPNVDPINQYNFNFTYDIQEHCIDNDYHVLRLVFLVKSAIENIERRVAIRNTWGYKKRFFDVPTRTVFLLGKHTDDTNIQMKINREANTHKDIIQANFLDSYYNNTIKTMMGFKWAMNYCSNSKFYMFVDDDMYVSVKNVLRFVRNPTSYPDYLQDPNRIMPHKREIREQAMPILMNLVNKMHNKTASVNYLSNLYNIKKNSSNTSSNNIKREDNEYQVNLYLKTKVLNITNNLRERRQIFDLELPDDVRLFAGYVIKSSPHRHKTSKWYVSLREYPYDMWPPYVTAGAYILSKQALTDMYFTSFYTKHFKFDDIFLGIVAKKADLEPFHCNEFHFYKKDYTKYNYKYVITSHGYSDPDELVQVWNEQKSLGNS